MWCRHTSIYHLGRIIHESLVSSYSVFGDDIKEDGEDDERYDDIKLHGHTEEGPQNEDQRCTETLQHPEVLERDIVVFWAAQTDETCRGTFEKTINMIIYTF